MIFTGKSLFVFLVFILSIHLLKAQEQESEEKLERHNIEIFNGITTKKGRSLYTLGMDYEYRLRNRMIALGLMTDYEFGHDNKRSELLITPTVLFYPYKGFKIFTGAGIAFEMLTPKQRRSENAEEEPAETFMLFRIGTAYDFELSKGFSIAPTFSVDIDQELVAWVYGVGFTWEF
ncbi:MAG: hypothetical protein NW226_03935 [Microscillaceae bacterium]|nr:hypothetical protein [Microscillaceae bacterium]